MRLIDEAAIKKYGIASITLMENAGRAVQDAASDLLQGLRNKKICVICGKGNNGGDGLVASRHFSNSGFKVDVFILSRGASLTGDPAFNLELLKKSNCSISEVSTLKHAKRFINNFDYGLVIDAIFGTGFTGQSTKEPIKTLISFVNSVKCKVVSVDIPSGLNGLSGVAGDVAIQADLTVTLGLPKRGFLLKDGPRHTGRVVVETIGFPKSLLSIK